MKTFLKSVAILSILLSTASFGATVTIHAKYGKTGSLAGNLNHVHDHVNGRDICPSANTNANGTAGCDMSDDPGLNDNGTPNDFSDDYYTGDMIVRTNDSFEAIAAYAWLGNAGGNEERVTITGTLPAGKGFVWDGIPGSCVATESSLSSDKKTIVCVKKDFDTNDVGSFAEDMSFAVKVEGDAVNGSTPGYVAFQVEAPNAAAVTDTTETANSTDDDKIIVTASPRWNIDKHGGAGYYTTQYGQTNPNTNETGWIVWYNFTIEVDEVPGETDDPINPTLGNEAIQGATDATITFKDDLSHIAPNAVLATWTSNNGCDMAHANSDEPYAVPNTTYPDRSISAPNGPLVVTCSPNGSHVDVTVAHVDASLTHAPTKTYRGTLLPVNRKIAAIGTLRVFIPLSDAQKGDDGVAGNGDDGVIHTTNCLTDFAPKGISGTDNFNGTGESTADNCYNYALFAARGSWSKSYRRGWSDRPDQAAQWGDTGSNHWWYPPTDAAVVMGGDGTATPGTRWGTYTIYSNRGGTDISNPAICDVIDIETYAMEVLNPDADDTATLLDDTKHAVDLNYGSTESIPGLEVKYAIGYVGTWPPDPDQPAGDAVAKECNATSITWYDDYVTAKAAADAAGTAVSKVRVSAPSLPTSHYMAVRIKHKARSNFFSTGDPIPNNTLLVNYATYKSGLTGDKYYANNRYQPHHADVHHDGGYYGDRLTMQRAKVRINKTMTPTAVSPGSEVTVQLTPSFTVDGPMPETSGVVIADLLPKGLAYKNGSTVGSYNSGTPYGEPTLISPATDNDCNTYAATLVADGKPCGTLNGGTGKESIVYWDLGQQTTGTVYGDINFTAIVTVDAPAGVLANYAQAESPADASAPSKRVANANVNNSVPSSLLIVKSVLTPLHEINKGSLLNWMEFQVGVRNGSSNGLTDLDMIDLLPFNGDGTMGSFTFTPSSGTTVDRQRNTATQYHGIFQFDSMEFDDNGGVCDASQIHYWYTQAAGPMDISPIHPSNDVSGGASDWCEGTASGPDAGCNFTNADVTAVRIRGIAMDPSATCYMKVKFATQNNVNGDRYSNTASAKAAGVTNAVLSNTVSARVYASSIGDRVWFDTNNNGVQDAGEPGMDGVTVNLYDGSGSRMATTTTSGGGLYHFPNLVAADYVVEVVPPSGYLVTGKSLGGNTAVDSDIDTNTHRTDTITLGEDEDRTDIDAGLYIPVISGHLFDDGDGDANVNGAAIAAPSGTQIHATLLDSNGNAMASQLIAADGTYRFGGPDGVRANRDYRVVISTQQNATTSTLPAAWNNTGEQPSNSNNGHDGTVDGILAVHVGIHDMPNNDFGINHRPTADDKTEASQPNPGGTTQVAVPVLTGHDDESGAALVYKATELPANATLYHANGTPVQVGDIVDPGTLKVDPDGGDQTVVFQYTTTDEAAIVGDPATVTMPFADLMVSGHLFDDGDGDANVNGAAIAAPSGTQLHATLLDDQGDVLATTPIASDGTYSFGNADGVEFNTHYSVVLATTANAATSDLPANWNNTGENINSAGAGNDGTADGKMTVSVTTASVPQIDFGINHKPVANDTSKPIQLNPGGATQVQVPAFNVTDTEDGTPATITIKDLPNNATLYYNGTAVTAGQVIPDFDPTKLTVDPIDGDQTVLFRYTGTDAAGIESESATMTLPFAGLGISGHVFDDGNGMSDGVVNGDPTNKPDGQQLYIRLIKDGAVVASKPLADDGAYQFIGTDGVTANTDYMIVLGTTEGTAGDPAPALPENWNNTGENINSAGQGDDGGTPGVIAVSLQETGIADIDFGINKKPVADDASKPARSNPSGNTQYPVPNMPISDHEDGIPSTVTITTLPDSATGTLYYDGRPVTTGQVIDSFEPGKLTVDPANGNQNVVFAYTTTDHAGVTSDPATVTMPFLGDMSVGDRVWMDNNGNGLQDSGEPGVAGVTVKLYAEDGTLVATTTTDSHGEYRFNVTAPGKYYVAFDGDYYYCPPCHAHTDSDVHGQSTTSPTFDLDWGDHDMTHDAGIAPTAHIGDYFWIDENANGIQDSGEKVVAGGTVALFDIDGNPVTDVHGNHEMTTDANGQYGFDVPPGQYKLRFTIPQRFIDDGYVFTDAGQGSEANGSDPDEDGFTQVVDAQAGRNVLTLDAGLNCGCANVGSDGADALSALGMLVMLLSMLLMGTGMHREEAA